MTSHWDSFYKTWDIDLPSQFAIFVATEAKTARRLVDLGTGSGRDALFFSRRFDAVVALDKSEEAIRKAREKATRARLENLEFVQADLGEPGALDAVHDASSSGDVYYGRFFLHAITEERSTACSRSSPVAGITTTSSTSSSERRATPTHPKCSVTITVDSSTRTRSASASRSWASAATTRSKGRVLRSSATKIPGWPA